MGRGLGGERGAVPTQGRFRGRGLFPVRPDLIGHWDGAGARIGRFSGGRFAVGSFGHGPGGHGIDGAVPRFGDLNSARGNRAESFCQVSGPDLQALC